jgi:hypothetical protein
MDKTRKKEYVKTRYIMAYLLEKDYYLNMSLTSIAYAIGKRDHTTIIHGLKVMENELELYEEFRELLRDVFVFVYGSDSYFPKKYKKKLVAFKD